MQELVGRDCVSNMVVIHDSLRRTLSKTIYHPDNQSLGPSHRWTEDSAMVKSWEAWRSLHEGYLQQYYSPRSTHEDSPRKPLGLFHVCHFLSFTSCQNTPQRQKWFVLLSPAESMIQQPCKRNVSKTLEFFNLLFVLLVKLLGDAVVLTVKWRSHYMSHPSRLLKSDSPG